MNGSAVALVLWSIAGLAAWLIDVLHVDRRVTLLSVVMLVPSVVAGGLGLLVLLVPFMDQVTLWKRRGER